MLERATPTASDARPGSYWMDERAKAQLKAGTCYPDNLVVHSSFDYLCQRWEYDK
jgi:hypothetical protein